MNDNDVGWDSLFNPYEQAQEEGRKEGTRAGLESGYKEGYKLGHVTALDIGIEIGFYQGVAKTLLQSIDTIRMEYHKEDRQYHRWELRLQDFIQFIDTLPYPYTTKSMVSGLGVEEVENCHSINTKDHSSSIQQHGITSCTDISELLDTLRSKYKRLITPLNGSNPYLNLHQVMNPTTSISSSTTKNPLVATEATNMMMTTATNLENKNDHGSITIMYDDW